MTLSLATLEQHCVLDPDLEMPDVDRLGVETGFAYDSTLFVRLNKRRIQTVGLTQNMEGGQRNGVIGKKAVDLDLVLKFSPGVVAARSNYPLVIRRRETARRSRRRPAPGFDVVLVDQMLSVVLREAPGQHHLHALFLDDKHMEKAGAFLAWHGVTYERVHPEAFAPLTLSNAAQCYQWTLRFGDLRPLRAAALELSRRLVAARDARKASPSGKALLMRLDDELAAIAEPPGVGLDDAYILLATAVKFGFVRLDPHKCLAVMEPLYLI
ncbi:hypothetical protein [Cupriavidus metallidurans]|uniref:hypothetical protein n=1 Tax=Cupriavidus metallidurans TaxID=119219 RepID=UPI001CC93E06|nr:hypothetical protein [Cupriavidus metallidurans]UBM09396.1 hypothetical protein LAI70_05750 [Cupriavidus metallidurans]